MAEGKGKAAGYAEEADTEIETGLSSGMRGGAGGEGGKGIARYH